MTTYDPLDYVLAYKHRSNWSRIECAQPGRTMKVFVHPSQEPLAQPIHAKGTLSQDRKWFTVLVTTPAGKQESYDYDYRTLLDTISFNKPD